VASALVSSSQSPAPPSIPPWIANRLAHLDQNQGPVAKFFERLAEEDTAKSRAIIVKADQVADALNFDDELIDGLWSGWVWTSSACNDVLDAIRPFVLCPHEGVRASSPANETERADTSARWLCTACRLRREVPMAINDPTSHAACVPIL
jgi:hypothetical protein